jgi:hypothetical protein
MASMALRGRCLPLLVLAAASCSDETATRPSPSAHVVEAGWSFGFCVGPCRGALQVQRQELEYRISSRDGSSVLGLNRGRLTASGAARLAALSAALPPGLQESYGCPDCADAGAAYVVLSRDGANRRSSYEYPRPPAELASLDAFLKAVMDALARCAPTPEVTLSGQCSPVAHQPEQAAGATVQ